MFLSKKVVGSCVLLLVLAFAVTVAAQPPAPLLQVYRINVKSGSQAQFAEYLMKIAEAANKTNAPQGWTTTRGVLGTSGTDYFVFLPSQTWGERDGWSQVPQMLTEAFGEAEAQKILAKGGNASWGSETTLFTLDAERTLHADRSTEANYYQILLGQVKPEMVQEYNSVVGTLMEAQKKAGTQQQWIRRTSRLGKSWLFYAAVPFDKWGEWDNANTNFWANVAKAVGEDEARHLQGRLVACYEEREIFVIQRIPELSRAAPGSSSN